MINSLSMYISLHRAAWCGIS